MLINSFEFFATRAESSFADIVRFFHHTIFTRFTLLLVITYLNFSPQIVKILFPLIALSMLFPNFHDNLPAIEPNDSVIFLLVLVINFTTPFTGFRMICGTGRLGLSCHFSSRLVCRTFAIINPAANCFQERASVKVTSGFHRELAAALAPVNAADSSTRGAALSTLSGIFVFGSILDAQLAITQEPWSRGHSILNIPKVEKFIKSACLLSRPSRSSSNFLPARTLDAVSDPT